MILLHKGMSYSNVPYGDRLVKQSPDMLTSPAPAAAALPMFSTGKAGVGLFFQEEKKELIVRNIVPGGSAAANGRIKPGDIIISVDGKSVEGQGIETLRDCIIGDIGTFVELSFIRPARFQTEAPSIFSITIERKSQTKTVSSDRVDSLSNAAPTRPEFSALSPNKSLYEAENMDLVKLQRRVSDLTFERADLQSLLDQKSKQAESRQKTIEMLEMQLQSTISENDRLNREVDHSRTRETQAQSVAASSSTQEATLASANAELQATVARLRDAAAEHGQALAAEQSARAAAEKELGSLRFATQADAGREDELKAAKEANARLAADNAAIRGDNRAPAFVLVKLCTVTFPTGLLDQAVTSHQQAQASFAASTSEAKAQRQGLELELLQAQQRTEQEAARVRESILPSVYYCNIQAGTAGPEVGVECAAAN
jgi:hypothetical protein